jgi:hypothetical protein
MFILLVQTSQFERSASAAAGGTVTATKRANKQEGKVRGARKRRKSYKQIVLDDG